MKKTYSVIIVLLMFTVPGCVSLSYYSDISGVEKIPCFNKEFVNKEHFLDKLNGTQKAFLDTALVRVNEIFVNGMFPFLFSESFEVKDLANPSDNLKFCSKYKNRSDLLAFVSLHSKMTEDKQCPKCDDKKGDLKQIKLVVSSYLYSLSPADRLEKVYTLIVPFDKEVKFTATDSVKFENIKFGKEIDTLHLSSSAIPIAEFKGVPIQLTPSFTHNVERELSKKYAILNAEIFPLGNILLISQDGGPAAAEIRGNVIVDAKIKLPIDNNTNKFPSLVVSVGVIRKVEAGEKTIKEDDDLVRYVVFPSVIITNLLPD